MVRPTGSALNDKVGKWTAAEMKHANDHWRRQFRGEARVKDDKEISGDDIAAHNLILWGDPGSNAMLGKIADKLPVKWGKDAVKFDTQDIRFRPSRAGPDLSEPPEPEALCGTQQWLHLPRV